MLSLAAVGGCAQHAPVTHHPKPLEKFTETIPGTLVSFEMIPIGFDPHVKPFWIGKTEVTWDEFDIWAFQLDLSDKEKAAGIDAESRPSHPYGAPDRGYGHQGYPALAMTHEAAEEYCRWLSRKTGHNYRLPTETEWEIACRSANPPSLAQIAWFKDNSDEKTHPVASKPANLWGIYDMAGNVAEWCRCADGSYVVCGGSFIDPIDRIGCGARKIQSSRWNATDPQNPKSHWWLSDAPFVGFRVVREQ